MTIYKEATAVKVHPSIGNSI